MATRVRERAEKLRRLFVPIISCRVVIELAGHHHQSGDRYHVAINLGLPGCEILVNNTPSDAHPFETVTGAADRAFDEAERQLEDWVRRERGHRHEARPR
jgi:ribosome-associated translation inhibitor RaiA